MRKILLGTTAVVGAALIAPVASAQEAPTVRVGGYFQAYFSNVIQSNPNTFNFGLSTPAQVQLAGTSPTTSPVTGGNVTGTAVATNAAASNVIPTVQTGSVKTGKYDLQSDAEIHIFVNGKAANGLAYGAVVEIAFDANEGSTTGAARRSFTHKTAAFMDEGYIFLATPRFGQVRFGDEDGPMGGLMNTGIITNFGTGGIYGFWQNAVIRPNRTTTGPGDFGDGTKIIYLSPQFFGFDAGVSWAPSNGIGQDTGCVQTSGASFGCDRTYAYTGATNQAIQSIDGQPQRRNEVQAVLRWRGDIGGVGIGTHVGYTGWQAMRDMTQAGTMYQTLRPGQVYQVGAQASAYGFTVGGNYEWGQQNFFHGSQIRGDQSMWQWTVGASYTTGPFTIGANSFWGSYSGTGGYTFCTGATFSAGGNSCTSANQGQLLKNTNGSANSMRRNAIAVGANYRLAPGLDLVAEFVQHIVKEPGLNIAPTSNNQDKLKANIILVGTRLAF
jgi:hypothetical protein